MKKLALTALILCATIANSVTITYAKENTSNLKQDSSITQSLGDESFSKEDYIGKMQKEMNNPGSKIIASSEKYIRISNENSDSSNKVKEFTKEGYKEEIQKEKNEQSIKTSTNTNIATPMSTVPVIHDENYKYNWIKLSLQVFKNSDGTYSATGFYEWKNKPKVTGAGDDIIALTHDSNITFDYSSSRAEAHNPGFMKGEDVTSLNSGSSKFNSSYSGIAYSIPLAASNFNSVVPYGLITTKVKNVNSKSNMVFEYAHKQTPTGISPSISIGPAGLSLGSEFAFDKANTGVLVEF